MSEEAYRNVFSCNNSQLIIEERIYVEDRPIIPPRQTASPYVAQRIVREVERIRRYISLVHVVDNYRLRRSNGKLAEALATV